MTTVYDCSTAYCRMKDLAIPKVSDLSKIGQKASALFKEICLKQPLGIIPETGFMNQMQFGTKIVVAAYPDEFAQYIYNITEEYFKPKTAPVEVKEEPKRKRKPMPVFTGKTKING